MQLGSTIVIVFEAPHTIVWTHPHTNTKVRLGQPIGINAAKPPSRSPSTVNLTGMAKEGGVGGGMRPRASTGNDKGVPMNESGGFMRPRASTANERGPTSPAAWRTLVETSPRASPTFDLKL